jgi:cytochrome bd-type quinol oxidase subunit 2
MNLTRGAQATDTLAFAAQGGFSGTIALTCSVSGLLPMPTCGISPNSVTPGGNATLTVNTSNLSAELAPQLLNTTTAAHAALLPMGIIGFVLILFDRKRRRTWALSFLMIVTVLLPAACGGGSSSPPPLVSYTVTVTATSGAVQHSTVISVTAQ